MSVKIVLPADLIIYTGGKAEVQVKGGTVGKALAELVKRFPGIGTLILGKDGSLLADVDIYVNRERCFPNPLVKPLNSGDELHVIVYTFIGG